MPALQAMSTRKLRASSTPEHLHGDRW
jgi:hypothetical protein